MVADIVVDLQFGSTAKGKLVQLLSAKPGMYDAVIRVQSIQAGHTVKWNGQTFKMRTIPCGFVNPEMVLIIGAGQFIELELLEAEIEMLELAGFNIKDRLVIDRLATIIQPQDFRKEKDVNLTERIGSTSEGAGSSLVRKIMRTEDTVQVRDRLGWFVDRGLLTLDTISYMQDFQRVLVEGSQGTMLSVHSSPYFPYVTSRECTASGILSEAGISPMDVGEVWGTCRTFPIRVGGNSGSTGGTEYTWEQVAKMAGYESLDPEVTTVTNRPRRIFQWSEQDFDRALLLNKPTKIFLTFVDYLNSEDYGSQYWGSLSGLSREWINKKENVHDVHFDLLSTGELPEHIIKR